MRAKTIDTQYALKANQHETDAKKNSPTTTTVGAICVFYRKKINV